MQNLNIIFNFLPKLLNAQINLLKSWLFMTYRFSEKF